MIDRRTFLAAAATLTVPARLAAAAPASLRMTLSGDCLFTQPLVRDDPALLPMLPILRDADVAIGNFEGTLADRAAWASSILPEGKPICGGLNIRGPAGVARDLAWLGFDMMATANNHAWDWGPDGLAATNHRLAAAGLHPAGTGHDLAAARGFSQFGANGGARVALIACASTFWPGTNASASNPNVRGRPGVNPLRIKPGATGRAADRSPEPSDQAAILAQIAQARAVSDVVVVSHHSHEDDGDRTMPARFQVEFARACVEAGAGVYFSHGPHILRGIDVYKGAPLLFGLGCFIFRNNGTASIPEELFEGCGLQSRDPAAYLATLSKGWEEDELFWQGGLAQLEYAAGRLRSLSFRPTLLQHATADRWGMPLLAAGDAARRVIGQVRRLSIPFGTRIEADGDCAVVRLD